jgi:hypothetical protein
MVISLDFQNALHAIDEREIGSIAGKHKNVLPLRTHESGNGRDKGGMAAANAARAGWLVVGIHASA